MPNSSWTETGSSISLVPSSTPVQDAQQESPDYLTNSDKITLMAQYSAELATKTQLDTTAASLSVSSDAYDNAVAAISTGLIAAGAPSNWATIWPDGTTSGPWVGIQTSLGNWWEAVATQRTALQSSISAAQAAAAKESAISASILAAQPHVVTWAYASKPALPSASYPAGYYAITTDFRTVQVSADGNSWVDIFIAANGLFGQITSGQIAAGAITADMITTGTLDASKVDVTNLNAGNITVGTLSASKVVFADGSALTTAARMTTQKSGTSTGVGLSGSAQHLSALDIGITAASADDVFNVMAAIGLNSSGADIVVWLVIDGNTSSPAYTTLYVVSGVATVPLLASITGLSAGSHTLQVYAYISGSGTANTTYIQVLCQRVY